MQNLYWNPCSIVTFSAQPTQSRFRLTMTASWSLDVRCLQRKIKASVPSLEKVRQLKGLNNHFFWIHKPVYPGMYFYLLSLQHVVVMWICRNVFALICLMLSLNWATSWCGYSLGVFFWKVIFKNFLLEVIAFAHISVFTKAEGQSMSKSWCFMALISLPHF